ncbi:MAG: 3-phosphoshikimate 1-carboxyvinyltransferase [Oscillospiraceae bacterium]|nr:3-phosphoshikimate 1-carboxyvinyltransferase [Oscillospiraceae bacterium]
MNLTIMPTLLSGTVAPPPSKSQAHRYLIAAALAGEGSVIENLADSQDIQATRWCMKTMMTSCRRIAEFNCLESGSTLRFLIPIALALRGGGRFTGHGRLMERPQQPYFDLFDEKGIRYELKNGFLTVEGQLTPGAFRLPGNVSSQFVTGLLYALPLLAGDSRIVLTTDLESRSYVDMTLEALSAFGVTAAWEDSRTLAVPGGQSYIPATVRVEGDWSQAAFWFAAISLGSRLEIEGLQQLSAQGDRVIRDHFVRLTPPGDVDIDLSGCPDLAPPLAAMAVLRRGDTRLLNAGRLRLKESDRLTSITAALGALGASIEEQPDSLIVHGVETLAGGCTVDCWNDHRIAMMTAIAATRCEKPVALLGAECVAKSYPDFWRDYQMLGGEIREHTGK